MIIRLLIIIVYVLCCYGSYKFTQIAHSEGGIWSTLHPNGGDVFFTFVPIFNAVNAVGYVLGTCYRENSNLDRFYKISK